MTPPKNDPKLWTEEGIGDAIDEATGEMGVVIEWGWICLGTVYHKPDRRLTALLPVGGLKKTDHRVELWGTVTVNEAAVRGFLHADAAAVLEPGARYELRRKYPTNYGRTHGMCWYRNVALDTRKPWGLLLREPMQKEGYLLVGEYTTPGKP